MIRSQSIWVNLDIDIKYNTINYKEPSTNKEHKEPLDAESAFLGVTISLP